MSTRSTTSRPRLRLAGGTVLATLVAAATIAAPQPRHPPLSPS